MTALSKWTARRVSTSLTIDGVDAETGRPLKVTNVAVIESGDPFPTATGRIKDRAGDQTVTLRP